MTLASGSQRSVDYLKEATFNTVVTDGAWKPLRNTGGAFKLVQSGKSSAEIRSDRQVANFVYGAKSASGEFPFELSAKSFDDMIEAALMGTWTANVLKVGSIFRSFSFQEQFTDIGEAVLTTGCAINSLKISATPDEVTGSISILGKDHTADLSGVGTTETYAPAETTVAFDGFTGGILVDGGAVATVTQVDISLENGMADRPVIGNAELEQSVGRSNVTGTITMHFETLAMYNKFANREAFDLKLNLTDGTNTQQWHLPKLFATDATKDVGGESDIFITLPFQGVFETTAGSNLTITRSA